MFESPTSLPLDTAVAVSFVRPFLPSFLTGHYTLRIGESKFVEGKTDGKSNFLFVIRSENPIVGGNPRKKMEK